MKIMAADSKAGKGMNMHLNIFAMVHLHGCFNCPVGQVEYA
jgi:hypothetical protein